MIRLAVKIGNDAQGSSSKVTQHSGVIVVCALHIDGAWPTRAQQANVAELKVRVLTWSRMFRLYDGEFAMSQSEPHHYQMGPVP